VVYDALGTEYIDYVLGKGPIILGHAHPAVQRAAHAQLERGNLLSLGTRDQLRVAELLRSLLPGDWSMRFHKTGSDACQALARTARAATGKSWILSAGYHGWHDWCSAPDAAARGQAAFADFHYDLGELARLIELHRGDIAAIFVEPQPGFLAPDFYHDLRAMADASGCLLAFDEVKSGFRIEGFTVHHSTGTPVDLFTLSKAISNGFSLSCLVGRADVMAAAAGIHMSGTYDIEATPFAAAAATLEILGEDGVLARISASCLRLVDGLNEIFARHGVPAKGFAAGTSFRLGFCEAARETEFYEAMAGCGILLYPHDNQFLSLSHDADHTRRTLEAAEQVIHRSTRLTQPQISFAAIADRQIHEFHHRKGYLKGAPGPRGR
jgi:glutamate-1-semialdehyde aminotransferase